VQARVFLVSAKDAAAEATLALLVQGALEGKAAPQREGSEADLLAALAAPRRAVLEWAAEALEELPVQAQIVLYLVLLIAAFVLICPLLRPLLAATDRRLHPDDAQGGGGAPRGGGDGNGDGEVLARGRRCRGARKGGRGAARGALTRWRGAGRGGGRGGGGRE
jgi:hypothetical protein